STLQEVDVAGKKAIVLFVPVPQLRAYQKIQTRLVRELEKKFSGKHVVIVARVCVYCNPRLVRKFGRDHCHGNEKRSPPVSVHNSKTLKTLSVYSRTLTSVHDAILEDLVFPSEIVGKRIRIKLDGSKLIKVHLDKQQQTNVDHKLETFSTVYKKLTGKDVVFEFPSYD
ncbi:PREDICTED: 40S ribosomal protein S7-like, partial [Acropora digitifera]|uniref:40S ribosomal protein S7-like n=1 Tax=Acropora digitifera TaxID=70779 RepID=UPI00077A3C0B